MEQNLTAREDTPRGGAFFTELARQGPRMRGSITAIYEEAQMPVPCRGQRGLLRIVMGKMRWRWEAYGSHLADKIASISLAETESLLTKWQGRKRRPIEYAVVVRPALRPSRAAKRKGVILVRAEEIAQRHGPTSTHLARNPLRSLVEINSGISMYPGPRITRT